MSTAAADRYVLACNPKPNVLDRIRAQSFEAVSVFPGEAPAYAEAVSAEVIANAATVEAVLGALAGSGLGDRIAGVLSHSEATLELANELARRLTLPSNPTGAVAATIDKAVMRERLAEDDRFAVGHMVVDDRAGLEAAIARFGKVVVKPRDGAGSAGVSVLEPGRALPELPYPLLAEAYIDGPEYSVEALSVAGSHRILGATEKFLFPGTVVESGHLFPARLGADEAAALAAFVADFLDRIGIELGVTHTEVKLTSKGPKVIETHTRSGGDHIAKLIPLATGIDPISASVTAATGGRPAFEARPTYWATTQYRRFAPGQVARVAGLDLARHMPGVNFIESTLEPGTEIRETASSTDRVLGVVAVGRDPEEALANAACALEQVRVDYA